MHGIHASLAMVCAYSIVTYLQLCRIIRTTICHTTNCHTTNKCRDQLYLTHLAMYYLLTHNLATYANVHTLHARNTASLLQVQIDCFALNIDSFAPMASTKPTRMTMPIGPLCLHGDKWTQLDTLHHADTI